MIILHVLFFPLSHIPDWPQPFLGWFIVMRLLGWPMLLGTIVAHSMFIRQVGVKRADWIAMGLGLVVPGATVVWCGIKLRKAKRELAALMGEMEAMR